MLVRNGAEQADVMPFFRADDRLGRPDVEAQRHARPEAVVAFRYGAVDGAVEQDFERTDGGRVVDIERHFPRPVSGKTTGMAAWVLHSSTSGCDSSGKIGRLFPPVYTMRPQNTRNCRRGGGTLWRVVVNRGKS